MAASRNDDVTKNNIKVWSPLLGGGGLRLSFGAGLELGVKDEVRLVPLPGHTPNPILYPGL